MIVQQLLLADARMLKERQQYANCCSGQNLLKADTFPERQSYRVNQDYRKEGSDNRLRENLCVAELLVEPVEKIVKDHIKLTSH